MKKLVLWTILLVSAVVASVPAMAGVDVSIGISLPPPIVFAAPPDVIAMPETNDVYVVPDVDVDIYFWNGWWWRPWEGRWYRSHYYNRGWVSYNNVPNFYFDVDPGWRGHYRAHNWYGHQWNYERIPNRRLQRNWKNWHNDRHWERQRTWGVQGYKPRPHQEIQESRHQRQQQYQQRPEVRRHQEQMQQQRQQQQRQQQQRQPHVQQVQHQPQGQHLQRYQQPQQQHSQPEGRQQEVESQHKRYQGK